MRVVVAGGAVLVRLEFRVAGVGVIVAGPPRDWFAPKAPEKIRPELDFGAGT